jgi:hypothetical protein
MPLLAKFQSRLTTNLDNKSPNLRYDGDLSAESWKMHYIGLGHSLERIPRFAPGCQAAYDDKCLKSPFP